jgi:phospholipid-binding lipoprotein MlaA
MGPVPRPRLAFPRPLSVLLLGALLAGCATVPEDPVARAEFKRLNDPLEPTNRAIFDFNEAIDKALIRPLAEVYHFLLPDFIEERITAFLRNLGEPLTLVNDVLQGEDERATVTFGRFVTNSTVGLAGIFDVATDAGLPRHTEDFGQTLAVWGVGDGPYLVLPFLGPSTVRDGVGTGIEFFADPVSVAIDQANVDGLSFIRIGVTGLDARARNLEIVDQLRRESLDYYATLRSAYRQNRRAEILNGTPIDNTSGPEFEEFEEFDGLEPAPPAN